MYQEQYKWHREVDLMGVLAKRAGAIALGYWNTGLGAETKADASPVTMRKFGGFTELWVSSERGKEVRRRVLPIHSR